MQQSFDFGLDPRWLCNQENRRVWLLASDVAEETLRARRAFISSANGAAAVHPTDLVLLKGKGDVFHLYQSEGSEQDGVRENLFNELSGAISHCRCISEKERNTQDILMLSFAPGRSHASGVFGNDRRFECRTSFERLLHRLITSGPIPHSELAFLIEQALPSLEENSHESAVALFLERYGNHLANAYSMNNDTALLKRAAQARRFVKELFLDCNLSEQARQNSWLAEEYQEISAQLCLPGFNSILPTYRTSGFRVSRIAGFAFRTRLAKAQGKSSKGAGSSIFGYSGSIVLPWKSLLVLAAQRETMGRRIVTHVSRDERTVQISLDVRDEFSLFSGVRADEAPDPSSYFTSVWSDDVSFERIGQKGSNGVTHVFVAELPPSIRKFSFHVSASLDKGEGHVARFDAGTPVGGHDVLF